VIYSNEIQKGGLSQGEKGWFPRLYSKNLRWNKEGFEMNFEGDLRWNPREEFGRSPIGI
jgi:hypothetical protein